MNVLDYPADVLPQPVSAVYAGGDLDLELLLAGGLGQFSSAATAALRERSTALVESTVSTPSEVAELVLSPGADRSRATRPFDLAHIGCSWFSRPGARLESVTIVIGDDPWDFAVAYALSRLTGAAYWMPPALLDDPVWLRSTVYRADRYRRTGVRRLAVTSVSSTELAAQATEAIHRVGGDLTVKLVDFPAQFPARPRRLLCTSNLNHTTRVAVEDGSMTVDMPTPELRTATDPASLY